MTRTVTQEYFFQHANGMWEMKFLRIALSMQSLFYIVALIVMLRRYKTLLFENYASNISLSNYRWLSHLITIIILNSLTEIKDLTQLTNYDAFSNGLTIVILIGGIGFIFWVVLSALYYPDLFRGIDAELQPVKKLILDVSSAKQIIFIALPLKEDYMNMDIGLD